MIETHAPAAPVPASAGAGAARGPRSRLGRLRRSGRRRKRGHLLWGYLMIAPLGLGIVIFYLGPAVQTFVYSFSEWGAFGGQTFTGLENYRNLFRDDEFLRTMWNSTIYTAGVLLSIPISIGIAAILNRPGLKGAGVYTTLYFLPMVTMPVAVAIMWRWIYNGDYGILNNLLGGLGVDGPHWITDPDTVRLALVIVGIWSVIGYNVVILSAGMKNIPPELYEAAQLDGAGPFRRFRAVTLPMLSPTTFFLIVITTMRSLQVFDLVFIMIGRINPALPEAKTVVFLFFEKAFQENDRGLGSAVAVLLFVVIMALTLAQFALQKRTVHYD